MASELILSKITLKVNITDLQQSRDGPPDAKHLFLLVIIVYGGVNRYLNGGSRIGFRNQQKPQLRTRPGWSYHRVIPAAGEIQL